MGIDAEILIRYKGEKPTEEQITRWSWDLARAVGAEKFFIQDGLPSDEYKAVSEKWHAAFTAHPLYKRFTAGEREVRNDICADVGEFNFTELRRAIDFTKDYAEEGETTVGPGKAYYQDGETLFAADGEWFMSVSLWSRYYGVGYERGDLMAICAVAEWVEANIPNSEVWYGGDSSGVEAELFNAAARDKLKKHFYSSHGRDYFSGFARQGSFPTPKPCGLCIPGEPRFNQHGFGSNFVAVNCGGCGKSFESRDNGATWAVVEEK